MGKKNFEYEAMLTKESVVQYLDQLIAGFESGTFVLKDHKDQMVLKPGGILALKFAGKQRSEQSSLSLEIEWKEKTS